MKKYNTILIVLQLLVIILSIIIIVKGNVALGIFMITQFIVFFVLGLHININKNN